MTDSAMKLTITSKILGFARLHRPCPYRNHITIQTITTTPPVQTFPESSFFKERRASTLLSSANIRAINEELNGIKGLQPLLRRKFKWCCIRDYKAACLFLKSLGWAQDRGQNFIYMALVEGHALMYTWHTPRQVHLGERCLEVSTVREDSGHSIQESL